MQTEVERDTTSQKGTSSSLWAPQGIKYLSNFAIFMSPSLLVFVGSVCPRATESSLMSWPMYVLLSLQLFFFFLMLKLGIFFPTQAPCQHCGFCFRISPRTKVFLAPHTTSHFTRYLTHLTHYLTFRARHLINTPLIQYGKCASSHSYFPFSRPSFPTSLSLLPVSPFSPFSYFPILPPFPLFSLSPFI